MKAFLVATQLLNGHPSLLENLAYQTVGIAVVLTSLGILWLGVSLMGRVLAQPLPAAPAAGSHPVPDPGVSPQVCAAITAAVVCSHGDAVNIRSIQPANPFLQAWSMEGRRQIFQSHKLR